MTGPGSIQVEFEGDNLVHMQRAKALNFEMEKCPATTGSGWNP
jgi:hypothetical protein